ncbi:flagellar export protein FliJ [Uliginosibacterium aquaticum]|uniref:Flagellar FliJ protein n=1 Tax=Uliginosibacterium aquaticum TaxID=2731212 RepID=A0ABX2IF88_9RHOO|nr:flagellar export protein FliJ [Uliginosibacterium aquaticum]NSL54832.1 flagellar export protein FliJ [Uliginosibacterium aquaticum]
MTHKSPLKTLQDLAHTRVDEATRRLGELISSEQACEAKLGMLLQYRSEYYAKFAQMSRNGLDLSALRNFSAFLGKLDDAIRAQQAMVDNSRDATVKGQEKWASEHSRAKAFDTLSQRQHLQEMQRQNKQEQRLSDEHAIKHYRRQQDEGGS